MKLDVYISDEYVEATLNEYDFYFGSEEQEWYDDEYQWCFVVSDTNSKEEVFRVPSGYIVEQSEDPEYLIDAESFFIAGLLMFLQRQMRLANK